MDDQSCARRIESEMARGNCGLLALKWEASHAANVLAKMIILKEHERQGSSQPLIDAFRENGVPEKVSQEHYSTWVEAIRGALIQDNPQDNPQ